MAFWVGSQKDQFGDAPLTPVTNGSNGRYPGIPSDILFELPRKKCRDRDADRNGTFLNHGMLFCIRFLCLFESWILHTRGVCVISWKWVLDDELKGIRRLLGSIYIKLMDAYRIIGSPSKFVLTFPNGTEMLAMSFQVSRISQYSFEGKSAGNPFCFPYAPWCWYIYRHLPEQNHPVM